MFRRIRNLREDNDKTQKEISEYLFCDQSLYSKYERGLRPIPVDFVIKLAVLYNTSTDYILGLTDNPRPYPKAKKLMIYKYIRFVLDLIYPSRCPVCGDFIGYTDDFCQKCRENINFLEESFDIQYSDFSMSVCIYDENISPAVFTLKDKGGNAPYAFAIGISELIKKYLVSEHIDFIIPVPMYKSDKAKRGYNQCELIASEISHISGIPHKFNIVFKIRKTPHQKELSKNERKSNLKNAFALKNPEKISGKNIILIDDVCTTGSTLSEISRLLKNNGAGKIFCLTYCRTDFLKLSK